MKYIKPSVSIPDQITLLKTRGLTFNDENKAAHYLILWNRRLIKISIPIKPLNHFIVNKSIHPNKVYAAICAIQYILNIISPTHDFKYRLLQLMRECPLLQEKEMGFPQNWQDEDFWKI